MQNSQINVAHCPNTPPQRTNTFGGEITWPIEDSTIPPPPCHPTLLPTLIFLQHDILLLSYDDVYQMFFFVIFLLNYIRQQCHHEHLHSITTHHCFGSWQQERSRHNVRWQNSITTLIVITGELLRCTEKKKLGV